ncbi:MAG: ABC transporter substrate-binding protein [Jatrophihabitans sp.]|uniref:ABC transporter substrate-binding protein n=1 Tax=Jatrophihabitans sp. TaxID=1932789 RepID=UPI003F8081FF
MMRTTAARTGLVLIALIAPTAAITGCSSSGSASSPPASTTASTSATSGSPTTGAPSSGAAAAQFPVTLGSGSGAVTVKAMPKRIVSLSATATEDLYAVGAGPQVVAVDKNSNYPADVPHTKIDAYQLDAEAVASYRPDLVIESGLTPAQVTQLTKLGLAVYAQPAPAKLDDAYEQILQIGRATGHGDAAAALVSSMRSKIDELVKDNPAGHAGETFYYELDQTYYSVTTATFIGQVFKLFGLTSIADAAKGAAAAGGYPQLSSEYILKADPTYVFLADTKCCAQSPQKVAARPGWSVMSAVKGSRIAALDDDIASRWGPRLVDLVQAIATEIKDHPAT